ncbi:MAG: hypothetical protein ACR2N7_10550 [Acidimicrobiia bacterium]
MTADMDARHRNEIAGAYVAVDRVRLAAKASAVIGLLGFIWTLGAMITSNQPVSEGMLALVALALATVVPAAGLYAASFRTSLGAARLERSMSTD